MATTFLLDPRVLDDRVSDSAPDVEIAGEAFAYFRAGENPQPTYTFYLASVDDYDDSSLRSLDVHKSRYDGAHGDISLRFEKADLIFMPVSDGDRYQWGSSSKDSRQSYLRSCEALYVRGKFLKGNVESFRMYGLNIKKKDASGSKKK